MAGEEEKRLVDLRRSSLMASPQVKKWPVDREALGLLTVKTAQIGWIDNKIGWIQGFFDQIFGFTFWGWWRNLLFILSNLGFLYENGYKRSFLTNLKTFITIKIFFFNFLGIFPSYILSYKNLQSCLQNKGLSLNLKSVFPSGLRLSNSHWANAWF